MTDPSATSSATLNRLSVYLRCLRELQKEGHETVSSRELADRFHLSSVQIRKDLAQFGDFGVRGIGYSIAPLAQRLHELLGLDHKHRLVIVGMGNLGCALAAYVGFNDESFEVVAGFDIDPSKVGTHAGKLVVQHMDDIARVVGETAADIGVLTAPTTAALECYETLIATGIQAILNFAPVPLPDRSGVRLKNVDLRVHLEEASFLLQEAVGVPKEAD